MDIIKKLQLNRNPKDLKSGSIIGAKNIMLDPISSSITNEYGFEEAYTAPSGYKIVGCISCNEEICIFLNNGTDSKIQRLKDNGNVKDVECNWKWEGGNVFGTFAYNYKNELILAISEENSNKDVPLKIINLNISKNIDNLTYNLEEEIPKFNVNYKVSQNGSLVCGVYTFFIRFLISKNTYTKWFQITDDIIIINSVIKDKPKHQYDGGELQISSTKNILINTNLTSTRCISLSLNIDTDKFSKYQIGYIIKHNTDIKGRILNNYDINIKNITVSNNNFLEETVIDNFLEEPNQFYNVKNLVNYNNRLYLSNYSLNKSNYQRNQQIANNVKTSLKLIDIPVSLDNEYKYQVYGNIGNTTGVKLDYICDLDDNKFIDNLSLEDSRKFLEKIKLNDFVKDSINSNIILLNNYSIGNLTKPQEFKSPQDNYNLDTSYGGSVEFWIIPENNNVNNLHNCIKLGYANNIIYQSFENKNYTIELNNNIYVETNNNNDIILKTTVNNKDIRINLNKAYFGVLFYSVNGNSEFFETVVDSGIDDPHWTFTSGYHTKYFIKYEQRQTLIDYSNVGLNYNNNRTLIPGQIYNFYIHFVKKDMSVTEGYRLSPNMSSPVVTDLENQQIGYYDNDENLGFYKIAINGIYYFYCPGISTKGENNKLIVPIFELNRSQLVNTEFIGYFISYEDVDIVSIPIVGTGKDEDENKIKVQGVEYKYVTSTDYIYNIKEITGNYILETIKLKSNSINVRSSILNKSTYVESYKEKHLKIVSNIDDFEYGTEDSISKKYAFCINNKNIYQNNYKTLYQLTNIVFINNIDAVLKTDYNTSYCYLPGFLNYEKVFVFDKELILSPVTNYNYTKDGNKIGNYKITQFLFNNYSNIPLNALSLKQDYDKGSLVITNSDGSYNKTVFNSVLEPNKLQDFLEIQQAYITKPIKSYTNYNEDTQDTFDKTIYRSDVISDESLNNGFRHFNIENYKNILENKGKIVNIVGVGLYMLVHTEYSLFVFDRNNQLSNNAQLQIPDTFDIDYKELTPSDEGFGGLKNKEESILTKHGYIWFDRITYSIFMFDGQIKPLSADIHNLLKTIFTTYSFPSIVFGEDYISNRLLISVKYQEGQMIKTITLSYSFDTNNFISIHDYTFDKNYKTYNNSYFFKKGQNTNNKLYRFNKYSSEYLDLFMPSFTILKDNDDKLCSYVDIIFNDLYETPKVLNSISYILSKNNNYEFNTNIIDQYFNTDFDNQPHQNKLRLYSGFKLYITTDLTFSGELDISQDEEVNKLNGIKPQWNNGVWNFNWFRENIKKNVTNAELEQQNVNQQMKEVYQQHDNLYQSGLEKSDMRSSIIGKYFIFRFVFERKDNLNLKFETLDANISRL